MEWQAIVKITETLTIGSFLLVTVWAICKAAAKVEIERYRQSTEIKKAAMEKEIWELKNQLNDAHGEKKKELEDLHKKIVEEITNNTNKLKQ